MTVRGTTGCIQLVTSGLPSGQTRGFKWNQGSHKLAMSNWKMFPWNISLGYTWVLMSEPFQVEWFPLVLNWSQIVILTSHEYRTWECSIALVSKKNKQYLLIPFEHFRRKFRSQTSDNMDRWKAEQGRGREKRKIRRKKSRRERVRRKKMQMREKVGKSRNTAFFQWFVALEGRKVGSLKRQVRSQLARGEMNNCTPLWREAHFQVEMYKTPGARSTFGTWDVEKAHAVVARSTFSSQNVKNTRGSDHFWRLRCRFASLRVTTLHYTLHYTTVHYTILHSTTLQLQLQNYTTTLHYTPLRSTTLNYTTLHHITLHSTTLHYITLHYLPLHFTILHPTTLHYTTTTTTTTQLHSTTLHYTKLHYTTQQYTTLHYIPLHSTTLHYITLHYITLNDTAPLIDR